MSMEQEIIAILSEINPYVEIGVESKLLEEQILDSLGILVLISELESRYKVQVPLDTIQRDDFETVSSIVNLVNRLIEVPR